MKSETILSVVALICSMIALFQTVWQVKNSNKQSLFDRRLNLFLEFNSLYQIYKENKAFLNAAVNGNEDMIEWQYSFLLNCSYLEECCVAFRKPLEDPGHKIFLRKREELRGKSLQAELIFDKAYSLVISEFIKFYEQLLFKIYQFIIAVEKRNDITMEEHKEMSKKYCVQLELEKVLVKLDSLYCEISENNIIEKIKQDINII